MGRLDKADLWSLSEGNHSDGEGLTLQVRGQSRAWILRYRIAGKDRYLGLGSLKDVNLKQARLNAGGKRKDIDAARKGERGALDPVVERQQAREAARLQAVAQKTFRHATEAYVEQNGTKWAPKHRQQWSRTVEVHVYPAIGRIPVTEVRREHILNALRPIWKAAPQTARRVRGRIETVLEFAEANGWRPEGIKNPAGQKQISMALGDQDASIRPRPALPYDRMAEFMADLRGRDGRPARALEFEILTTTRARETVGAKWSEVDWVANTFTVPAARMKGTKDKRREHVIPLSPAALALLRKLYERRSGDLVFNISQESVRKLLRTMNAARAKAGKPIYCDPKLDEAPIVPHGIARASFRTWASEKTNFSRDVAEKALAHQVGDETERAYDRGVLLEKRRKLMNAWAAHCGG